VLHDQVKTFVSFVVLLYSEQCRTLIEKRSIEVSTDHQCLIELLHCLCKLPKVVVAHSKIIVSILVILLLLDCLTKELYPPIIDSIMNEKNASIVVSFWVVWLEGYGLLIV